MSTQDYRSIARKFDEFIKKNDLKSAKEIAFNAIKDFDENREYTNSINLIEKMLDIYKDQITTSKLVSHLIIRALITGNSIKVNEYKDKLDTIIETSLSQIVKKMLESKLQSENFEYILDSIEYQTIFGKFEQISEVPFLEFENEDAVFGLIEDYFNYGRYIVNLIQVNSSFHHSITVDIGNSVEVSITEKRRILKIE